MNTSELQNIRIKDNSERYRQKQKQQKSDSDFRSAGLKIGICVFLCIVLCIVNLTIDKGKSTILSSSDDAGTGKLRFVELPGIIEVFAGGDRLTMPIGSYTKATINDDNLVTFTCEPNAAVVTCSSGTVKAVGEDKTLGNYVIILHGDIETYYYGLGYITVEERQIINTLDTLGLVSHKGVLYFKVCKNGRAQNPTEYLPIRIG